MGVSYVTIHWKEKSARVATPRGVPYAGCGHFFMMNEDSNKIRFIAFFTPSVGGKTEILEKVDK